MSRVANPTDRTRDTVKLQDHKPSNCVDANAHSLPAVPFLLVGPKAWPQCVRKRRAHVEDLAEALRMQSAKAGTAVALYTDNTPLRCSAGAIAPPRHPALWV